MFSIEFKKDSVLRHNIQDVQYTIHNYLAYEEPGKAQRLAREKGSQLMLNPD